MDIAALIDKHLQEWHPCTCDAAYKDRRLVDPNCIWHEIQGDGELLVEVLIEAGVLPVEEEVTP